MKNKGTIRLLFLLSIFGLFSKMYSQTHLHSQNDTMSIYNIYAILGDNSTVENLSENDTILSLSIGFKVDYPGSLNKIYIQLGATPDGIEFGQYELSVIQQNGVLVIYENNQQLSRFWKRDAVYRISVNRNSLENLKWLTIYCKDEFGKYSLKQYVKIQ